MNAVIAELTVRFPADLLYLRSAARLSRAMCEVIDDSDLQEGFTDAVELTVSEAFTNAVRHSQKPGCEGCLIFTLSIHHDRLMIEIRDSGPGFDIDKIPEPDFAAHPDGGYGLYIIRSLMDRVSYTRGSPLNTFTMEKCFRKIS